LDHSVYVPKFKCQHEGAARVLTFQPTDMYICMSHETMHHLFCRITN